MQSLIKSVLVGGLVVSMTACTVTPSTNDNGRFQYQADIFSDDKNVIPIMDNFSDSYYQLRPDDELEVIYHFTNDISGAYLLEPGDAVAVKFVKTPELDLEQRIRPDGKISLQYIGDVQAAGRSVPDLTAAIKSAYKKILSDPAVLVVVNDSQNKLASIKESLRHYTTGYTRKLLIKPDGRISMPLIGEVDIREQSVSEVNKKINKRYQQSYPSIRVDLLVNKSANQHIYVLGEVNKPGAFKVNRPTSVVEALALAGGTNSRSNIKSAIAMRRVGSQVIAQVIDVKNILEGKDSLSYLLPEDTLYLSQTRLSKASDVAQQLSNMILFKGWGFSAAYRIDDKDTDN